MKAEQNIQHSTSNIEHPMTARAILNKHDAPGKSQTLLEDVVIELVMGGADRGALVQRDPVGVCVLLLSVSALRVVGRELLPILMELGDEPVEVEGKVFNGVPEEQVTMQTPATRIFDQCAESPRKWLCFELPFGEVRVVGYIFTGAICERVASACCKAGCACSLDPKKAAPGYEIERIIRR